MLEPRHLVGGLIANRFTLIRVLRENMFHARDGRRHVAIELVPTGDHDLGEMRRVLAIANTIEHPNLCRPREVLEHAGQLVIVTEIVEGVSIGDRLVIGPYNPLQVGALMVDLLSVLARIHAEGLAHGGISPSTVMIDAAGLLRLTDLGVVRGPHRPTARLDIEAVGALAATMLAGYLGSVPGPLLAWIARCADRVRPFPDVAAAAAGLVTPEVVSTEAPRARVMPGKKVSIPLKTERVESSVAIKIPTLESNVRPLEVVPVVPELHSPAPSASAEAPAPAAEPPTVGLVAAPIAPIVPTPVVVPAVASSRFPRLVGGLATAVAAVAIFVWWSRGQDPPEAPHKPSVIWVSEPIEQPRTPNALRPLPPLPTGAVPVDRPVVPVVVAPSRAKPLEVVFSPEAAWIETPGVYVLEEVYRQLLKHPLSRIEVTGYSSTDGTEARNAQLASGRAMSVKKYLVERGVEGARISTIAKSNAPDANSRRAEVRIVIP